MRSSCERDSSCGTSVRMTTASSRPCSKVRAHSTTHPTRAVEYDVCSCSIKGSTSCKVAGK
eukprot:47538-Eustigmatos_ZCMA.PRE.1